MTHIQADPVENQDYDHLETLTDGNCVTYLSWPVQVAFDFPSPAVVVRYNVTDNVVRCSFCHDSEVFDQAGRPAKLDGRLLQLAGILRQSLWLLRSGVGFGKDDAITVCQVKAAGNASLVLRCVTHATALVGHRKQSKGTVVHRDNERRTKLRKAISRAVNGARTTTWKVWRALVCGFVRKNTRLAADEVEKIVHEICDHVTEHPELRIISQSMPLVMRGPFAAYRGESVLTVKFGLWGITLELPVLRWCLGGELQYLLALERKIASIVAI